MRDTIEEFVRDAADLFIAEEIDALCDLFASPCTVYVGTEDILITDPKTFRKSVNWFRQSLTEAGLETMKIRVSDCSMQGPDRATVTVCCRYFDAANGCLGANRVIYYIRLVDGTWRIELTEHVDVPFEHKKPERSPEILLH